MSNLKKEPKDIKDVVVKERVPEKKRRRTLKTEPRGSGEPSSTAVSGAETREVIIKKPKTDKVQNGRVLFYQEEEEVDHRDPKKDLALHKQACDELRKMMAKIKSFKEQDKNDSEDMEEARVHGVLQFVTLKKLNRLGHLRSKKARDATNEAKQQVEQHHLQLQNLLYEVTHLQKEINKCLQFKSNDEDVNLITVDQFYSDAPSEISKPEQTRKDLHQQTLARLDWELEQRKRLSTKLQEAQDNKHVIAEGIHTKREYLESLQPKLSSILQATKPVQQHLGLPFDEIREQHRTARYLPRPLYVVFMQVTAFKDACDKNLTVNIHGDVDVAKAMDSSGPVEEEDSDSDQEEQEKTSKKRRHRSSGDRLQQQRQKILKKHPLSVSVHVKCPGNGTLQLIFNYLVSLEIATVSVKVVHDQSYNTVSGSDLLSADSLLQCLYPDDLGNDTPNPSNKFALSRHGMEGFSTYIPEVGHPYKWAQLLCGLQFLGESEAPKARADISASYIEETINRLRKRVTARLSLQKQLASLERCSVPVSSSSQKLFPAKISSRIVSWKRSTYEDFVATPYAHNLKESGMAMPTDTYFVGIVERGSAKLTFQVVVSPDYPCTPPGFAISVQWHSERTNLNCENIRDLEAEVNIHYDELLVEKLRVQLLTNQVQRLLMCFDVYLETESENAALEGPVEFAKEKIFPRGSRGPQRSRPYMFNAQLGFFCHR